MSGRQPAAEVSAAGVAATAEALQGHRRRAWWQVAGAPAGGLLALALLVGADGTGTGWLKTGAQGAAVLSLVALVLGVAGLVNSRRMRSALQRGSWVAGAAEGFPPKWGGATVVLRGPVGGGLRVYAVIASKTRTHLADPGPAGVLWWCGDPSGGGVVSRPGGAGLVWVRPLRSRLGQRRYAEKARDRGILERGEPRQPDGTRLAPGSPAPASKGSILEAAAPRSRKRRIFPWVLVAGLVLGVGLFAVGGVWTTASDDDPRVELTVISLEEDGNCTVTWTDPWDFTPREGPFRCDPARKSWMADPEWGWIVSYGPWKGDLYNARLQGSPANTADDIVGLTGFGLILLSLAGGAVLGITRFLRRRPVAGATSSVPVSAIPVGGGNGDAPSTEVGPDLTGFTYAVMAEAARERSVPRTKGDAGPRVEADVRTVPWWRVRTLLQVSRLGQVAVSAGGAAACGVVWWLMGAGFLAPFTVLLAAGAVWSAYRAWWDVPAARALARAARTPVAHPRRYVLLHDPLIDTPVMVLYPAEGGDESVPEATLEMNIPGTRKAPHSGLPAPVGHAELRGGLEDGSIAVPWVEGRPRWPRHQFVGVDPHDPEELAYLERLVSGEADQEASALRDGG